MKISNEQFCEKAWAYYAATRTHAIAFWKLTALAAEGQTFCLPEWGCYYAVYKNFLFAYFSPDGIMHIPADELNEYDCVALEAKYFDARQETLRGFTVHEGYKLHYGFAYVPPQMADAQYEIVPFDFADPAHYGQASVMMNQGAGDWMMPDNIRKIMREPVFDGALWFFARECTTGQLAGIAISTYDGKLRETDMEWFYVLPTHHGKGAGRLLVQETINRSRARAKDIRVGGTNEFYKKCGFVEKEKNIWAAKEGFSLVAPCIQPNVLP